MAFSTHCCKRSADWRAWLLAWLLLWGGLSAAFGQGQTTEPEREPAPPQLSVMRMDNAVWLSARFGFELPAVVQEALLKGIPIFFVAQADLVRERWYWFHFKQASVQRRARLSYHPLTRRWQLSTGDPQADEVPTGLTLNRSFESLDEAMAAVRRISLWKLTDVANLTPDGRYQVRFRFALDTDALPRPLQIGTLGQSDWVVSVSATLEVNPELLQ